MTEKKKVSLAFCSIRKKLNIAFSLMSILPVLVFSFLLSKYIIPHFGVPLDIVLFSVLSASIALTGYLLIKEVIDRILSVSSEVRLIAAGQLDRSVTTHRQDEVGDLGDAVNKLTSRIRSNMEELKSYGERTTEVNFEIQKRVLLLSSLLQISSLVSQGGRIDDILKVIIEKARLLANSETAFLLFQGEGTNEFCMRTVDGPNAAILSRIRLDSSDEMIESPVKKNRPCLVDKNNSLPEKLKIVFPETFKIRNAVLVPVFAKGVVVGVLGIGNNREQFAFDKDDVDLLDIFAKQVSIALENNSLMHRVEKLEIRDVLTGLYNESFMRSRLSEEIRRAVAYQRPCSFIVLNIDNFQKYHNAYGTLHAEATLKKISSLIKDSVTDIERVGRMGDNEFAILVPERNKRQAQEIAEYIRKKIEFTFSEEPDKDRRLTVSGGVSEDPLDGTEADQLIAKARELVALAKTQGKNRIVGLKEKAVCL
ncbi:MAG: diguanylate cyclase [Candidatus Omnitrophica bacterium]|nr:diguanylate cyclase [Candidatus Omnitrophota bacterium]